MEEVVKESYTVVKANLVGTGSSLESNRESFLKVLLSSSEESLLVESSLVAAATL